MVKRDGNRVRWLAAPTAMVVLALAGVGSAAHAETVVPRASAPAVASSPAAGAAGWSHAMAAPSTSVAAGAGRAAGAASAPAGGATAAAATITVRGRAWNDRNRNGVRDGGEPGVAGLPVAVFAVGELAGAAKSDLAKKADLIKRLIARMQARDTSGDDVREAVTGSDGTYRVTGLPAGTVVVLMGAGRVDRNGDIPAVEWTFTRYAVGGDRTRDSDFVPSAVAGGPAVFGVSDVTTVSGGGAAVLDAGLVRRPMLAVTGTNVAAVGGTGAALVGVGLILVRSARRRQA